MSEQCYPMEELARINELPTDDPARGHLARCPRCRARLAAFTDFLSTDTPATEAELSDAEFRLTAALNREIFNKSGQAASIATEPSPAAPQSVDPALALRRLLSRLSRPALRPVWGFAVGLLLFFVLRGANPGDSISPSDRVLRGDETRPATALTTQSSIEASGEVLFSWMPIESSDSCEIVFYAVDLSECGRIPCNQATQRLLSVEEITGGDGEVSPIFWRVVFLRNGNLIGKSSLASLPANN